MRMVFILNFIMGYYNCFYSHKFFNIENGGISVDSGTSGATPTIASIITLVNDARLSAGKNPVGFINPAVSIYYIHIPSSKFNRLSRSTHPLLRMRLTTL